MMTEKHDDDDALRLNDWAEDTQPDRETGLCRPECPHKIVWEHPYWNHTAWCWHQMKDLGWYDYWLADCIENAPDKQLTKHKESGGTDPQ